MSTGEKFPMNTNETEQVAATVTLLAPYGLGFGEGGISIRDQLNQEILTESSLRVIHEHLTTNPEAFKQVTADDDGCGDGRPWQSIEQLVSDENGNKVPQNYEKSLLRAKIFGGGLVVATSMLRALHGAPVEGESLDNDRENMAKRLEEIGLHHGAHTDNHATGEGCGCGAIDKYPLITANAVKYQDKIYSTLEVLYGEDFADNQAAIEQVLATYAATVSSESYFAGTSGKKSMQQIKESGAVVKELYGHHIEETIVLNDIPGTTLDQQFFTETVKNKSEEKPKVIQAFSVDIWRGEEIAKAVALLAHEEDISIDVDEAYKVAYADFLIRTLAVAATLTDGSLPVYRRHAL